MTGIQMRHVPYRGGGMALNDVVAGHVPVYFADAGPAATLIRSGQLRALGVTTATRASHLPEVPTLHEAGVEGYEANTWQMMVGPARMPEPIVMRLNHALADFMRDAGGAEVFHRARHAAADRHAGARRRSISARKPQRWTKLIKGIGVSID